MTTKVIIKPITDGTPSGMVLVGSYQYAPGKLRILVSENSFLEVHESDKFAPTPMNISFGERTPVYSISYDPSSDDEFNNSRKEVIEKFFAEHPLLTRNGKPTKFTKAGLYDMYSEQEKTNIQYDTWKENLQVMNRLDDMSENELCDVWYYYGVEPSGKNRGELIVRLGAPGDGLAIKDLDPVTQKNKFMVMFSTDTKSETEYIVNMRKCLMHGIIDDKVDGMRHNFYHGTTFIGTSFNDVIAYAKREDRIYKEHIVPRIKELEDGLAVKRDIANSDDPFTPTKQKLGRPSMKKD